MNQRRFYYAILFVFSAFRPLKRQERAEGTHYWVETPLIDLSGTSQAVFSMPIIRHKQNKRGLSNALKTLLVLFPTMNQSSAFLFRHPFRVLRFPSLGTPTTRRGRRKNKTQLTDYWEHIMQRVLVFKAYDETVGKNKKQTVLGARPLCSGVCPTWSVKPSYSVQIFWRRTLWYLKKKVIFLPPADVREIELALYSKYALHFWRKYAQFIKRSYTNVSSNKKHKCHSLHVYGV